MEDVNEALVRAHYCGRPTVRHRDRKLSTLNRLLDAIEDGIVITVAGEQATGVRQEAGMPHLPMAGA